jgi:uncharacterized protein YggE
VATADIQTSQLTLNPNYNQDGRLVNYTVTDTVTAKIHDLATAGNTIDDAVTAAGNDAVLQSVQYSVEDDGPLQASARAGAVQEATADAQAMAKAAGLTLGPVTSINDDAAPQVVYPNSVATGGSAMAGSPAAMPAAPVQAGSEEVQAQVTMTFATS